MPIAAWIALCGAIAANLIAFFALWKTVIRDRRSVQKEIADNTIRVAKDKEEADRRVTDAEQRVAREKADSEQRIATSRAEFEAKVLAVKLERDLRVDLRLERLDTKMETVWTAFTAQLLNVLHHPDPAKIIPDALLKKYEASIISPEAITYEELLVLVQYMMAVVRNEAINQDERAAARQILILIRHHALWDPTVAMAIATDLNDLIGPDLHPKPLQIAEMSVTSSPKAVDAPDATPELNVGTLNVDVLNVKTDGKD